MQASIAIVEHDAQLSAALSDLLRSSGHDVILFRSPEEFLARTGTEHLAGVVADVEMPGVTCVELAQALAAASGCVPIILITAKADAYRTSEAEEAGVVALLHKPFDVHEFLDQVEHAFKRQPT